MLVENPPVALDVANFDNALHYRAYRAYQYLLGNQGEPFEFTATVQYFAGPAAADNTAFVSAKALPASSEEWIPGTTGGVTLYTLDYPQTLRAVCSAAQSGDLVIEGTDILDTTISETVTLNGTTAVHTTKAFKTVTKFTVPAKAGTETISIGTHATASVGRYGLMAVLAEPMLILCDAVTGTTAPPAAGYWVKADLTATASTGGDPRGLWRPSTAPDGTKSFAIVYVAT